MDENYPDYRIAALKCLSDAFPDILWSDIQMSNIEPVPPSGCWRVMPRSKRRFFVYVGQHPKAPSAEEIYEDQFNREYPPDDVMRRKEEINNIQANLTPIVNYGNSIGHALYLKSIKESSLKEPWKGEPAWLKDRIKDPEARRAYWNKTLKDAGVIQETLADPASQSDNNSIQSFEDWVEAGVKRADRNLIIYVIVVLVALTIGIAMDLIPPFVLASLAMGAVIIWQKNR